MSRSGSSRGRGRGTNFDAMRAAQSDVSLIKALQQIETALAGYARAINHGRAIELAGNDTAKSVDRANRLFRFGRTSFMDALASEANFVGAEAALTSFQTERWAIARSTCSWRWAPAGEADQ